MDRTARRDERSPVPGRQAALVDQAVLLAGAGEAAANHVAARQLGLLHVSQARRCGLGRKACANRCARGSWRRLYPRVFLVGSQEPSDLARVFAATMDAGPHAAAAGATAAFAYGLSERPGRVIHLATAARHNPAARPGVRIHRPRGLNWDDFRFVHGIPVTSPAETLLALAGEIRAQELEAVCALALRRGLLSAAALAECVDRAGPRPGLPALRAAIRAPALTRSRNERRMLALLRRAELPEPLTNQVVLSKELDLYWPEAKLGVEVDAFSTHGSIASFEDDHRLDADMEAADVRIVRFTGRRIRERPEAVVAKLAAILALRLGGLPAPRRR